MRVLALAVAFAAGCDAPVATRTLEIRGGSASSDAAVVAIGAAPAGCEETMLAECSGVRIGPRAVLTAAHCTRIPGRLAVFVGADVTAPGAVHDVALAIAHPSYVEGVADSDIAVLVLATTPEVGTLPLAGMPTAAADVGRTVRAVGFGATDETGAGIGVRRQGTSTVAMVTATTFRTTPGPGLSCAGDSGGPVLIDRGGGEVIAGVTSQGDLRCATYATNVDVAAHRAFIDQALATATAWTPGTGMGASCAIGCATDDDCAVGLSCEFPSADDTEGRCVSAPLPAGDLRGECAHDDECGSGTCARVRGEQACRCLVPCGAEDDDGCRAIRGRPGVAVLALIALFVATRPRRRRQRTSRAR